MIAVQSYTTFEYSEMTLSAPALDQTDLEQHGLDVSVVVTNTGAIESKHTVLLFLSDNYRIISPEVSLCCVATSVCVCGLVEIMLGCLLWLNSGQNAEEVSEDQPYTRSLANHPF